MKTICKSVESELIIKNSRFITILFPINKKEDVKSLLEEVRKKYPKATHYCYAYKIFDYKKCDDDGEPSNTAGMPILNVLEHENIENILCVVIRYFGGIKLGAGGLVRAYSKSTSTCINKACFQELEEGYLLELVFSYDRIKKIDYLLKDSCVLEKNFNMQISYQVLVNKKTLEVLDRNEIKYKILKKMYIQKKVI